MPSAVCLCPKWDHDLAALNGVVMEIQDSFFYDQTTEACCAHAPITTYLLWSGTRGLCCGSVRQGFGPVTSIKWTASSGCLVSTGWWWRDVFHFLPAKPEYSSPLHLHALLSWLLELFLHLWGFFSSVVAVLPGFRRAIYNGLRRTAAGYPYKELSSESSLALVQQKARSDKYHL